MSLKPANNVEVQDEGASQGFVRALNFTGAGVTATVAGSVATVTVPGGGAGSLTLTTVEVDLGNVARLAGTFDIAGVGMTPGDPVLIVQASGPYTGKGTREDESEMDGLSVSAKVFSATIIRCFWRSWWKVKGNFKFDYAIG